MSNPNLTSAGSNPVTAHERTTKFLESLLQNVSVPETDVYRQILTLKKEKNKLKERRKKIKAVLKAKTMEYESIEKDIEHKELEISRLEALREIEMESENEGYERDV